MTNRNFFAAEARLAQLVEHQTFNLRAMGSSPISGSNGILYVCTLYGTIFSFFLSIENVRHFSNISNYYLYYLVVQYWTFYTRSLVQSLLVLK